MCEVVNVYLYGCDTFIGLLSLARNHNATLTVVDHWDAHLGLHLTEMVLYGTLTFRPNKGTGRTVGIAYSEHPVEAVFLVTGQTQSEKEGCGRAAVSPRSLLPYPFSLSGLWLPLILKRYYLKI